MREETIASKPKSSTFEQSLRSLENRASFNSRLSRPWRRDFGTPVNPQNRVRAEAICRGTDGGRLDTRGGFWSGKHHDVLDLDISQAAHLERWPQKTKSMKCCVASLLSMNELCRHPCEGDMSDHAVRRMCWIEICNATD